MALFGDMLGASHSGLLDQMAEGVVKILSAPIRDPSILWIILPMLSIWLIIELYFGRFKSEKLGWNSALANGMGMFWVSVALMRFLFANTPDLFGFKLIIPLILLTYGVSITVIAFLHKLPERIVDILASPSAVYYPAIMGVLWVYGLLKINLGVILDIVLFYPVVLLVFYLIRRFEPKSLDSGGDLGGDLGGRLSDLGGSAGGMPNLSSSPGNNNINMPQMPKL